MMTVQDHADLSVNDSRTGEKIDAPLTQTRSRRVRGFVYFIQAGDAIKIGFSKNPPDRLAGLQTSHHEDLLLLGSIKGTPEDERNHHQMFCHLQLRGEWFRAEEELVEYINSALLDEKCKPPRRQPSPETFGVIKGLIKKRRVYGYDSPPGRMYSNLIEQTLNYEHASGDQAANLRQCMAWQIAAIPAAEARALALSKGNCGGET